MTDMITEQMTQAHEDMEIDTVELFQDEDDIGGVEETEQELDLVD